MMSKILGKAKIQNFTVACVGEADVIWLEVSVNNPVVMRVVQRHRQLRDEKTNVIQRKPCMRANEIAKSLTTYVFEYSVGLVPMESVIVNRRNTMMEQACTELNFLLKVRFKLA